jgi:hypothetical protein
MQNNFNSCAGEEFAKIVDFVAVPVKKSAVHTGTVDMLSFVELDFASDGIVSARPVFHALVMNQNPGSNQDAP